jgi:hypothetical protein
MFTQQQRRADVPRRVVSHLGKKDGAAFHDRPWGTASYEWRWLGDGSGREAVRLLQVLLPDGSVVLLVVMVGVVTVLSEGEGLWVVDASGMVPRLGRTP